MANECSAGSLEKLLPRNAKQSVRDVISTETPARANDLPILVDKFNLQVMKPNLKGHLQQLWNKPSIQMFLNNFFSKKEKEIKKNITDKKT